MVSVFSFSPQVIGLSPFVSKGQLDLWSSQEGAIIRSNRCLADLCGWFIIPRIEKKKKPIYQFSGPLHSSAVTNLGAISSSFSCDFLGLMKLRIPEVQEKLWGSMGCGERAREGWAWTAHWWMESVIAGLRFWRSDFCLYFGEGMG